MLASSEEPPSGVSVPSAGSFSELPQAINNGTAKAKPTGKARSMVIRPTSLAKILHNCLDNGRGASGSVGGRKWRLGRLDPVSRHLVLHRPATP